LAGKQKPKQLTLFNGGKQFGEPNSRRGEITLGDEGKEKGLPQKSKEESGKKKGGASRRKNL